MKISHVMSKEKNMIRERTQAGMIAARARGRLGGRPKLMNEKSIQIAQTLHANPEITIAEICRRIGVSRATFYRNLDLKVPHPSQT